jgi:glycosyltransferase involved in cell wall biosynthesis
VDPKHIIISCSNAGSLINFRGKLIQALHKHYTVNVLTPIITDQDIRKKLLDLGVNIYEVKLNRNGISLYSDLQYIYQTYKVIKHLRPHTFFAYTVKPVVYGSIIATLCGVKNIVGMLTGLGYSFTPSSNKTIAFFTRRILKFSLGINKQLKVIFQNKDDYNELLERKILAPSSRAFVVNGSGVDLSHYHFSKPDISRINFIMISRLLKSKGVSEYVQAAETLKRKYPDVTFTLAGGYEKGSSDSIEEDLYQKIKANDIIRYLGWVKDIRDHLQESTTVVLPSFYREGIPRSLLEGLAMGRPIITTNMIGCREAICAIPGQENGFQIPPRNAIILASKMEYLINNPDQIVYLGKNARLFAEQRFDVEAVNKHMIDIFME